MHYYNFIAPDKSWDNVRSSVAPYTESRLTHLVRNKRIVFPVVEQMERIPFGRFNDQDPEKTAKLIAVVRNEKVLNLSKNYSRSAVQ